MFKKVLIASVICLGLMAVVFGKKPFRYAKSWACSVKQSIDHSYPLDYEIEEVRKELVNLRGPIEDCMRVVAEQEVDVSFQGKLIAERRTQLEKQKVAVLARRAELKEGNETYVYFGKTYTSNELKRDLTLRFNKFKAASKNLDADSRILDARRKVLQANQKKLDEMFAAKKELEVKVEELEARWKTYQASQVASEMQLDDTKLSRVKNLIRDLDKRIQVKEKLQQKRGIFTDHGFIPIEEKHYNTNKNIEKDIDAFFGVSKSEIVKSDK